MRLSENIIRIREVMGLISEQKEKIYHDKEEYEKALKIYDDMMTAHLWSVELKSLFTKFSKMQQSEYENILDIFRTPLGKKMEKITGFHIMSLILTLGDKANPERRYLLTNFKDNIRKIFNKIHYDVDGSYPTYTVISPLNKEKLTLFLFPKPQIQKPVFKDLSKIQSNIPIKSSTLVKPQTVIKPETKVEEPKKVSKPKTEIDGDPVYGPGNSLIGFVKDRKFIPVSDPSMMPNKNNYYNKMDWDLLQDKEKMKEYLYSKFGGYLIYESMKVDDFGRLHDDDSKTLYPYARIAKFVTWFDKEFGDYAAKQGWFIVSSDSDIPKIRYKPEDGNKFNLFFQVQRIDDPMEGEALFGRLKNDHEADELAKKLGLVLDEHGVVIGWDNEIFI